MSIPRTFLDLFGHPIELTAERWLHVLEEHQELQAFEHLIPATLRNPDLITRSVYDPMTRLYYKWFSALWHGKYFVVVVHSGVRYTVLTAYLTHKIKGGEQLWPSN